jgi:hypothetical protein
MSKHNKARGVSINHLTINPTSVGYCSNPGPQGVYPPCKFYTVEPHPEKDTAVCLAFGVIPNTRYSTSIVQRPNVCLIAEIMATEEE